MTDYRDMPRLSAKLLENAPGYVCYWCPGCKTSHNVPVTLDAATKKEKQWVFDGNYEAPTLSPSVRHFTGGHSYTRDGGTTKSIPERTFCHYHIVAGKFNYCNDCDHALSGVTGVDIPDFPL